MSPLAIVLLVVGGLLVTIGAVWCAHHALRNQEREERRREANLCWMCGEPAHGDDLCPRFQRAYARGYREAGQRIKRIKQQYAICAAQERNRTPDDGARRSRA